jgi:hypothetical protein
MRQTFIPCEEAPTRAEAQDVAPWAAEIIECEGGYMAFESVRDAETWQAQL